MQSLVPKLDSAQLFSFDVMKWHIPAIDGKAFNSMLKNKLCQVFQTEFVHFRVLEVNQAWNCFLSKVFIWQDRMANNSSHDDWSRRNVFFESR